MGSLFEAQAKRKKVFTQKKEISASVFLLAMWEPTVHNNMTVVSLLLSASPICCTKTCWMENPVQMTTFRKLIM